MGAKLELECIFKISFLKNAAKEIRCNKKKENSKKTFKKLRIINFLHYVIVPKIFFYKNKNVYTFRALDFVTLGMYFTEKCIFVHGHDIEHE